MGRFKLILTVTIVLLLAAGLYYIDDLLLKPALPESDVWFDDIANSDVQRISQGMKVAIVGSFRGEKDLERRFDNRGGPSILFVTLGDGANKGIRLSGTGNSLTDAIDDAKAGASSDILSYKYVKFDFVTDAKAFDYSTIEESLKLDRSLYGVAFGHNTKIALLPEEVVAYNVIDKKGRVRFDSFSRLLAGRDRIAEAFEDMASSNSDKVYYRFKTESFFSDGNDVFDLFRGHRRFPGVTKEDLITSLSSAGSYLVKSVNQEGRFIYEYLPHLDGVSGDYNVLRHCGTIYSMMELYDFSGDKELLDAAKQAIKYLIGSTRGLGDSNDALLVVEDGYVKLGGNALAVIALSKYMEVTGDESYLPLVKRLSVWIESAQDGKSGRFTIHKMSYPGLVRQNFVSGYYPGEAILAMLRFYVVDGKNERWLNVAGKAADYLINVRDKDVPDQKMNHDHWLLYGLNELYRHKPEARYISHAFKISKIIMLSQNRSREIPDWYGSYYRPPRSTPTATRSEGLSAAYRLAKDFGYLSMAKDILDSFKIGIEFQLQTQIRVENSLYFPYPLKAIGGFQRGLDNPEVRIDYVQHNISALLACLRIMDKR